MTTALERDPTSGVARFIPALGWLRGYRRSWLSRDLLGGLAAGSVVIPQAMAYASIAGLPAQVGLYTCMVPMLVYALLGGSRTLSVSTTSTVAVLTGSTLITAGVAANSADPARDLATLTVMVGLILFLARVMRLGGLIDNISGATLTGIKIGVGLTVAAGQLSKLLGVTGDPDAKAFFAELRGIFDDRQEISWVTVAFSVVTLAVLVIVARVAPQIPGPLLAVVGGIVSVAVFSLDEHGLAVISPVPSGLPTPVLPSLTHVDGLLGGAFAIAVMCFLETAAVAGSVRRRDEPPIDNNQELVANGIACVAGGLFRAMPSAGGFSQTAMNQRAGARTQLSEIVTALLAVACALFLGGVLSDLPEATLGCMVMVAVIGLIKPSELVRYWRLDRAGFWVAVVTAGCGLVLGLLAAVLVGVVLTLILVLRELDHVGVTELQPTVDGADDLVPAGPVTRPVPGLLVLRLDGPLYTANVRRANERIVAAVDAAAPSTVVVDASAQAVAPLTVIDRFPDLEAELAARGVTLYIAALPPRALTTALLLPALARELTDEGRLYPTALAAVRHFREGTHDETGHHDG